MRKLKLPDSKIKPVSERTAKKFLKTVEECNKTLETFYVRVEEEAKQAKIKASAEAEAIRIKSEALQKNPKITEYEAIQKWDGKLPVYMLGNSIPFINIGK